MNGEVEPAGVANGCAAIHPSSSYGCDRSESSNERKQPSTSVAEDDAGDRDKLLYSVLYWSRASNSSECGVSGLRDGVRAPRRSSGRSNEGKGEIEGKLKGPEDVASKPERQSTSGV